MKRWIVAIGSVIAALALVAGNVDEILSFGAKWLAPYLKAYTTPRAEILVLLADDVDNGGDASAIVFIADPQNTTQAIAVSPTRQGRAVLSVPANTVYTIGWQGPGLEAGASERVLAVEGKSSFRLEPIGKVPGQIKLSLRATGSDQTELHPAEPSAKLLLSASAVQSTNSSLIAAGALPEFDRAITIIGLFETGTTDCARRLFFVPHMGGKRIPAIGCLGISIPGWLSDVIVAMDRGEERNLDTLLHGNADLIRTYAKDWNAIP
jgi:hypothetical protein